MTTEVASVRSAELAVPPGARPLTLRIVVYVAVYLILMLGLPAILDAASIELPGHEWWLPAFYFGLAVAGVWVFRSTLHQGWLLTRRHPWKTLGLVVSGFVAVLIAQIGSNLLLIQFTGDIPSTRNQDVIAGMFDVTPVAVLVPTIVILGPFVEELVFREVLLTRMHRWIPTAVGIGASGIFFAALHMTSAAELPALLPYALLGLLFATFFVLARRNILVSFGIHALWNAFGVVVLFVSA